MSAFDIDDVPNCRAATLLIDGPPVGFISDIYATRLPAVRLGRGQDGLLILGDSCRCPRRRCTASACSSYRRATLHDAPNIDPTGLIADEETRLYQPTGRRRPTDRADAEAPAVPCEQGSPVGLQRQRCCSSRWSDAIQVSDEFLADLQHRLG